MEGQYFKTTINEILTLLDKRGLTATTELAPVVQKLRELAQTLETQARPVPEKENFLSKVLSSLPCLVSYMDRDLNYLYVNSAYERWFGVTEAQCLRSNMSDILGNAAVTATRPYLNAALQGKEQYFETEVAYKTGGTKYIQVNYIPDRAADGAVQGIIARVNDITTQKDREEDAQRILEAMTDGFVRQDAAGKIIQHNQAALAILGLTEDQIMGRTSAHPAWKAIHRDGSPYKSEDHPAMIALRSGKNIAGALMGLQQEGGETRWLRINANPYSRKGGYRSTTDETDADRQVICTFIDVSNEHRVQDENRFILDELQIGIWKFNPVDHSLHWDNSMYKLFDINPKEFNGHYQAWESSLTPDAKALAVIELQQALAGEKEFNTSFEIQTKSKGKRIISGRGKVLRNEAGMPLMMYGINLDVTDQKHTEQEKLRLSRLLEVVLQNVPSMIQVKDFKNNMRLSLFNKAGEQLLGLTQDLLLGKNDHDLFSKEQADLSTQSDLAVFASGHAVKIEQEEISTPSGQRFLSTYKVPTFDEVGNPHLLIGISNDITQELIAKRKLEQERLKTIHIAKLAALGEMSAGVAHEINNPLAIIAGSVNHLVKFKDNPEKLTAKIESIRRSCGRIAKIVKGLEKFSHSSEGSNCGPHTLSQIVKDSLVLIETKSLRHNTRVICEIKTEATIFCDEVEIEQVVINLVNNSIDAVKNNKEKWVKLEVVEDADSVMLVVTDSGPGIPLTIQDRLFEPFFTTKTVGEGTGLGLSITKGILDTHKATITINPAVPNTCFEIRFQKPQMTHAS